MSYLDKCFETNDMYLNKLKPSRNLIVFILSENSYSVLTLNDYKKIMTLPLYKENHYIEESDKLESFFFLPNRIVVDSSLETCFNEKANTMKLILTKNKFRKGFGENKQLFSYYTVSPVSRNDIGSDELSVFEEVEKQEEKKKEIKEPEITVEEKEKFQKEISIHKNKTIQQLKLINKNNIKNTNIKSNKITFFQKIFNVIYGKKR